jgi:hypothetical protein
MEVREGRKDKGVVRRKRETYLGSYLDRQKQERRSA